MEKLPTPAEIVAHLDQYVHGQSRAKHDLSVAVYNHYMSQAYADKFGEDLGRHHTLLIGPTGSGKTFIIKTLAKYLKVPFAMVSATDITETGYKGKDVSSVVEVLLNRADSKPKLAEKGIIFIDEIDKVKEEVYQNSSKSENVQQDLLTYLDGILTNDESAGDQVDTSKILFIASGAFVGLDKIIQERLNQVPKPQIGFHLKHEEARENVTSTYQDLTQTQTCDLIKFGLIPEFIGRFTNITVLNQLRKGDLKAIMESKKRSPLELHQKMARVHGIDLVFEDEALDLIAEEAQKMDTGARGLNRLLGQSLDLVEDRFLELANEGVAKIVISADNIRDCTEPRLVPGDAMFERLDEELRTALMSNINRLVEEKIDDSNLW